MDAYYPNQYLFIKLSKTQRVLLYLYLTPFAKVNIVTIFTDELQALFF